MIARVVPHPTLPTTASTKEAILLKPFAVLILTLFTAFAAHASDCTAQAVEKKLSGAAKSSFIKKCVSSGCSAQAAEKKLAGAAKASFTKKCVTDALAGYCGEQAANKKLAGAARSSFLKKCQSGK
jgi:hypothetical protein